MKNNLVQRLHFVRFRPGRTPVIGGPTRTEPSKMLRDLPKSDENIPKTCSTYENTSTCNKNNPNKRCHFPGVGRFPSRNRKVARFRQVAIDPAKPLTKPEKSSFFSNPKVFGFSLFNKKNPLLKKSRARAARAAFL